MPKTYLTILLLSLTSLTYSCKKGTTAPTSPAPALEEPKFIEKTTQDTNAGITYMFDLGQDTRILDRQWQGIPSIVSTREGNIMYAAWYTGGKTEGPGNYITLSVSRDSGKTWKNDQLIIYPNNATTERVFDPCLWRDHNNNIWFFWAKSAQQWDGKAGVWASKLLNRNGKIGCTRAQWLADGIMMNKPTEIAETQETLLPIAVWNLAPVDPAKTGAFVYSAHFRSGTEIQFDSIQKISSVPIPASIRTFDEHQFVQIDTSGELACFVRTKMGVYSVRSHDYGRNWETGSVFRQVGNTTQSRFNITRLQSGNLMLTLNNSITRTNMKVFISTDNGKTWPYSLVLDARTLVSYPDVTTTDDGSIHVIYDRDRFGTKEILYCRFTEDDVLHNNIAGIRKIQLD